MPTRNYYVVLGVASTESDRGIRAAFRDLAKKHHPDQVGASGAGPFREIKEAYEVLGDPTRRREYDDALAHPRGPLVRELSLRQDLVDARPSPEEIFSRFARNFTGVSVPKAERPFELGVDVALSPEEARRGTRLRLAVPVFSSCTRCGGRGCFVCHGRGTREVERPVNVDVPPMSGAGATFVVPLSGLGIHNFFLNVRVRIDRYVEADAGEGGADRGTP